MNKNLLTVLFIFCIYLCQAQDPSFSQFYASRIYLNPAFTGIENGVSFSGTSRNQWGKVDRGFRTYIASVEIQEPFLRSGFGLSLYHDTEGLMQLNTNQVSLSYAYHIPMDKHNIHIGFEGKWVQKSVDWDKIVFSDELDPVFGAINPTTALPLLDKISYTDFDVGILWRFDKDLKIGRLLSRNTRTSIGLSLHHLPYLFLKDTGNESFQNLNTQTSPRLTLHGGTVIPLVFFNGKKSKVSISPNIKIDLQGDRFFSPRQHLQVFTYGLYLLYDGIYIGAFYQNKHLLSQYKDTNAFIFAVGAYLNNSKETNRNFFLGLSYDANTTGLGPRAGGVYEIAFRWTMKGAASLNGFQNGRSKRR
ncbi:MAG: type IX secretion system PorP/SprF family membrane protein, partial [Saprospiraceae bacterium]